MHLESKRKFILNIDADTCSEIPFNPAFLGLRIKSTILIGFEAQQ
jgi:hypothetical protein